MAEIPLQAAWMLAFRKKDGYQLMTLLAQEPRLLTIKYRGCTVLHLAMRKNWYGLVSEIFQKFEHLYKDETSTTHGEPSSRSEAATPNQDTNVLQSSHPADSQATTGDSQIQEGSAHGAASSSSEASVPNQDTNILQSSHTADPQATTRNSQIQADSALGASSSRSEAAIPNQDTIVVQSSHSADTEATADDSQSKEHSTLDLACFRELLEAKEGDGEPSQFVEDANWKYGSGLDVLAMAVIHGHAAINTILAEAISKVDGLFDHGHPYKDAIILGRATRFADSFEEERKMLNERIETYLKDVSSENSVNRKDLRPEPDVATVVSLQTKSRNEWQLTSPFLSYGEFLYLAFYSRRLLERLYPDNHIKKIFLREQRSEGFRSYCDAINDTWGNRAHHAVRGRSGTLWFDGLHAEDSAGRMPIYTALGLRYKGAQRVASGLATENVNHLRTVSASGRWELGGRGWWADLGKVSAVNGWPAEEEVRAVHAYPDEPDRTPTILWRPTTPLQLAAYVGDLATLRTLANDARAYDPARLSNLSMKPDDSDWENYSALHVAALAANPQAIRIILSTGKFDPLFENVDGNTALHLATYFEVPHKFPYWLQDLCEIPCTRIGTPYKVESSLSDEKLVRMVESRRQGCINLLLQAGIDVWQTNKSNDIADPGPNASPEYSTWWYEKVTKETQEARSSLNAAANAISVTGALVATASYVGPLQPPLGYTYAAPAQTEGLIEKIQVGVPSVRIFMVCNTLAFYLALVAIILSLTPSLPMPQASVLLELKHIRRTVTLAVFFLIVSIVAVLFAFASASIAVVPNEGSWNHGGLTVSTLGFGGFFCLLVLILCILRLLRLAFHRKKFARVLYEKYMYL